MRSVGPRGVLVGAALLGASCAAPPRDFLRCEHRFDLETTPAEVTVTDAARSGSVGVRDGGSGAWISFRYRLRGDEMVVDLHVPPSGAARLVVVPDDEGAYRIGFGGPPDVEANFYPTALGTLDMELFVAAGDDEDDDR